MGVICIVIKGIRSGWSNQKRSNVFYKCARNELRVSGIHSASFSLQRN